MYQSLTKTFSYRNSELEKPKVLLLAPTCVAEIKIDGRTIYCALHIPISNFRTYLPALNDKMRSLLRNKFCEMKAIIIVEVSVISNDLLFHIDLQLLENVGCLNNTLFAALSIIMV